MTSERRYGGSEDRGYGRDEEWGGSRSRARDEEDRGGGYFLGRDQDDDSRSRMLGSRDEDWRGRSLGGSQSSRLEPDRDMDRSRVTYGRDLDRSRDDEHGRGGYGRMGLGERGGWGSSHGMMSRDRQGSGYGGSQGSYGGPQGGGSSGYGGGSSRDYGGREHGSLERGSREHGSRGWMGRGLQDRSVYERDQEEGGFLHRMGEGIKNVFGMGDRDRGPHFGKGPKGFKRSDDRIREEVSETIARQGWIDASDVEVKVQSGEVTLSGTIGDREHKRALERMIEDLPGVDDVHNEIRVKRMTHGASAGVSGTQAEVSESTRSAGRNARTS